MENNKEEILRELINSLDRIKVEVAELESRIAVLEGAQSHGASSVGSLSISDEAIDLDFINSIDTEEFASAEPEDLPAADSSAAGMDAGNAAEPETAVSAAEPEAARGEVKVEGTVREEQSGIEKEEPLGEDDFDNENLFGEVQEVKPERHQPKHSKRTINEKEAAESGKAVMDVKAAKCAWKTDIPGAPVKDIRSAISLNDKLPFIENLFRSDSMLMQDVIAKLNAMESLEQAEVYVREQFPDWDMNSDTVYKFMMAVRRKVR